MTATPRTPPATTFSSDSAFTCNKPTGTAEGDVLLAFQSADLGGFSSLATPTGGSTWQLLASRARDGGTGAGTKVWWKVAGSAEPSTYGFSQDGTAVPDGIVAIVAVPGARTDLTPVVAQTGTSSSTTSISTPTATPNGADDLELRWAVAYPTAFPAPTYTWTPPSTYTELVEIQSNKFTAGTVASKQLASSSATGSQTFTGSATAPISQGFTVDIASALPAPPRRPNIPATALHRAASW